MRPRNLGAQGRLPRPRVINAAGNDEPVDELLIPLLDEAVRRDLAVEAALKRGDIAGAAALMAGKSKRHAARDRAAQASADGDLAGEIRARDDESVYTAIRADITQDEGSYSRFLDKDEWYERQRRRTNGAYDPADDPLLNPPWTSSCSRILRDRRSRPCGRLRRRGGAGRPWRWRAVAPARRSCQNGFSTHIDD